MVSEANNLLRTTTQRSRHPLGCTLLAFALTACTSSAVREAPAAALLPGDVAQVADAHIPRELVRRTAFAAASSPKAALDALTEDALLAAAARARGLESNFVVRVQQKSAVAAWMVERTRVAAESAGSFTSDELTALREARWREFARPPAIRTAHALVQNTKKRPWDLTAATEQARRIQDAVRNVYDAAEFTRIAKAAAQSPFEVRVEDLPPMAADGRVVVDFEGSMDPTFAAAATKLAPGELSEPVETKFGVHVIYAVERMSALAYGDAELIQLAAVDLMKLRRRRMFEAVLASRRAGTSIEVAPAVAELMTLAAMPAPTSTKSTP